MSSPTLLEYRQAHLTSLINPHKWQVFHMKSQCSTVLLKSLTCCNTQTGNWVSTASWLLKVDHLLSTTPFPCKDRSKTLIVTPQYEKNTVKSWGRQWSGQQTGCQDKTHWSAIWKMRPIITIISTPNEKARAEIQLPIILEQLAPFAASC